MEVDWYHLVDPKDAAVCFDLVTIYYDPKKGAKTGPEIVRTPDYVKNNFKNITISIKTKKDIEPIDLPVCGEEDRKKVIVFQLEFGHQKKQQRVKLKAIPVCPTAAPAVTTSSQDGKVSNSGWKFEPLVNVILCSLILCFQN